MKITSAANEPASQIMDPPISFQNLKFVKRRPRIRSRNARAITYAIKIDMKPQANIPISGVICAAFLDCRWAICNAIRQSGLCKEEHHDSDSQTEAEQQDQKDGAREDQSPAKRVVIKQLRANQAQEEKSDDRQHNEASRCRRDGEK